MAFPPTLADFGHGSMTLSDGTKALGTRPLLVILVDWNDQPSTVSSFHTTDYYEKLAFGDPTRRSRPASRPASSATSGRTAWAGSATDRSPSSR
jgi:hypothetical protein